MGHRPSRCSARLGPVDPMSGKNRGRPWNQPRYHAQPRGGHGHERTTSCAGARSSVRRSRASRNWVLSSESSNVVKPPRDSRIRSRLARSSSGSHWAAPFGKASGVGSSDTAPVRVFIPYRRRTRSRAPPRRNIAAEPSGVSVGLTGLHQIHRPIMRAQKRNHLAPRPRGRPLLRRAGVAGFSEYPAHDLSVQRRLGVTPLANVAGR